MNGYDLLLTVLLAVCTVLMTRLQFSGAIWGSYTENYFRPFGWSALLLFLVLLPLFYCLIVWAEPKLRKGIAALSREDREDGRTRKIVFWTAAIAAAWLPYYLSYYPGGVYSDTVASLIYHFSHSRTNRHPFLYNTLIGLAVRCGGALGKDVTWSMGLFLAVQMLLLEAEILYFLHWMLEKGIDRRLRRMILLVLVFWPLVPLYGISIWKDTPFCMAVLFWSISLTDLYLNIRDQVWDPQTVLRFMAGAFLTAFTRNNGIYVVWFSAAVFAAAYCRKKFPKKALIFCCVLFTAAASAVIQGPVYRRIGVEQTDMAENLGIPLQQIGAAVAYGGNIREEQMERLSRFLPPEQVKEHYTPGLADHLKWDAGLDPAYLSEHMGEFWDLWLHLGLQNPRIYAEAYLLETAGFWDVGVATGDAYVQTYVWNNTFGITQTDLFEKWFGFSFRHLVDPKHYISGAWFFWIFFVCLIMVMKRYGWRKCYLFTPQMGVWLTVMIATPAASSLRYIAPLLFTLPFALIWPVLLQREQEAAGCR